MASPLSDYAAATRQAAGMAKGMTLRLSTSIGRAPASYGPGASSNRMEVGPSPLSAEAGVNVMAVGWDGDAVMVLLNAGDAQRLAEHLLWLLGAPGGCCHGAETEED